MADFRRWMTVLAVMALFVGLASAQVGNGGSSNFSPFTCSVQNTVTPQLRQEGFTETTGDILIVCTGGTPVPVGQSIPTIDITVFYNVPAITSRLLASNGASEAVLLIDEPDNGLPSAETGYGPSLPQLVCNSATQGAGPNGCPEFVGTVGSATGVPVQGSATSGQPGANVFQGVVNGTSVVFFGIPVLPPVTAGFSRVFRITNVRVNANGAGGGVAGGPGQVNASITTSNPNQLPLTNPNPIVAFISPSLKTSVSNAGSFPQCNATTAFSGFLQYSESFPSAFKTRVDAKAGGTTNFSSTVTQNVPGLSYNSESNFIVNGAGQGTGIGAFGTSLTGGGFTAGLADYGTRFKAIFTNIPTGVILYVSTTNVSTTNSNTFGPVGVGNATTSPFGTTTATSFAVMVTSETASDGTGTLPIASATNSFTPASGRGVNYVAFTSQGTAIPVVWEVVNTQPTVNETFVFSVQIGYSNVTQTFPPAQATGTVTMTYAPTPTNGAFSATSGGTASTTNQFIPRFADTSTGSSSFFTINLCETTLLFPYITTQTGFDTGIVIANTTTDPFKTTNQQGTCTLNWYQGSNNPAATVTPVIATGTIYVNNASATGLAGQNFNGYMIATCNFQLAHGVAEVMDVGIQHLLSAYLALVVPTGTNARNIPANGNPEALNN